MLDWKKNCVRIDRLKKGFRQVEKRSEKIESANEASSSGNNTEVDLGILVKADQGH